MTDKISTFIVVRGLPGSGKTHLAKALAAQLSGCVVLDPDEVDQGSQSYKDHVTSQVAEGVDPKLHLYRFLRAKAYQAIEDGKTIIRNQPFSNLEVFQKIMQRMKDKATESDRVLRVLIVEVELDPAKAEQRVADRKQSGGHGPSKNTFNRFNREYATFENQGYDIVRVAGDADTDESVSKIREALLS